ncbi:hypothetical protein EPN90_04420 [Patescibacteria group bacterium]|nr:MAG: hypothetical protein EPN90_04420 [Patescibacteria group bacterium]
MRVLSEIDAEDGWLITLNSGWFEIRMWRDGHWLDEGGGLVERARIAAAIPYEYPDGTEISEEFPDDLYPERYG